MQSKKEEITAKYKKWENKPYVMLKVNSTIPDLEERNMWLLNNVGPLNEKWIFQNTPGVMVFIFMEETDAMAFKLIYGE